jgi:hypothetical protein
MDNLTTRFGYLACLLLLCCGPICLAQEVTVRVINAANRRPLQKQAISVSFLYDKKYDKEIPAKYDAILNLETDVNGQAHFKFPEPPPVHFSAQVRVDWSRWMCGCVILGSTDDLVRKGIVGPVQTTESKKSAVPYVAVPGEILFVDRPLSFFERLLYPIMKE